MQSILAVGLVAGRAGRFALLLVALPLLFACAGQRKYVVLSPEGNYSDDPEVIVKVVRVQQPVEGRTEIELGVENRRPDALSIADAVLLDADEKPVPRLGDTAAGEVAPGETKTLLYAFDTTKAATGAYEMRLEVPGVKVWPVVFSKEKPPEFKPTPDPAGGPQGPGTRPPGY